jgi:rhodanese-related sulfurtransferase
MFGISSPNVPEIDAENAWEAMQKKKKIIFVDVRTPHEYSRGYIKGSINIPVGDIEDKIEKTISDKSETVIVYCLSGSRSVLAVEMMIKMGYKKVFSMTSGLLSWRSKGFSLTQPIG